MGGRTVGGFRGVRPYLVFGGEAGFPCVGLERVWELFAARGTPRGRDWLSCQVGRGVRRTRRIVRDVGRYRVLQTKASIGFMYCFASYAANASSVSVAVITGGSDIQGMDRKSAQRGFESLTEVFVFGKRN